MEEAATKRFFARLTGAAELRITLGLVCTAIAVWITIALWPYPPLTDRSDPEYAERFAAAAYLVDDEPGLNENNVRRAKATLPRTLENLRESHPNLTDHQVAELEGLFEDLIEDHFERMRAAAQHFLAETLSARDLEVLRAYKEPLGQLLVSGWLADPRDFRRHLAIRKRRAELGERSGFVVRETELLFYCTSYQRLSTWGLVDEEGKCKTEVLTPLSPSLYPPRL